MSRGYKVDEVDAFLDRVEATLSGEPVGSPVTADEVDDVVFRVRFGGYDEWQVDVYLDRVARQLAELEERGVLGTAPAPDYGKPDTAAAAVPPAQAGPGQRRNPEPAPTQAIPASEIMAARAAAPPPPPAREPVGRSSRSAPPPDPDGFGDLRGDDDEGFGFLAGPPGDDYDDPFAKRGGQDDVYGAPPRGGAPEPHQGDFGAPRGPEPAAPRGGDFGPPGRDAAGPPPRGGMPPHDAPHAGPSPHHGATEQLPLQSDPRRGGFPQQDRPSAGGYGPPPSNDDTQVQPAATGSRPPGRRAAPDPAPGFGAAYDDEMGETGRRAATPPHGPSSQPPMPPTPPGPPTGPIPQAPRQPMQQPGVPPPPPTAPIQQPHQPPQGETYGSRGRTYGRDGFGPDSGGYQQPEPQHDGFAPEGPEDTGYGRRAAPPSPPPPAGGFGPPSHVSGPSAGHGAPPPPADNGAFGAQQHRGAASPPDFGRRNPYEGRGFEAPGRHGREEMTTEMRASDSPFTPDDVQRLEQLRRAFQPRRFGSGYDPTQVDQMFDAVSAAMTGRNPVPLSDRELDTSQFSLVQGGYFEAEVDSALREVRELFARRGMMH
ncbi:hypothetical protein GCM10028833_10800 [Glycomyces tarimensis]